MVNGIIAKKHATFPTGSLPLTYRTGMALSIEFKNVDGKSKV